LHPICSFFNYLKRIDFSLALTREHIDDRALTDWYPDWMYELMETDEVRNAAYRGAIDAVVAGKTVLELGVGRKALWALHCARAGARQVYGIEANRKSFEGSLAAVQAAGAGNVQLFHGFSDRVELPEPCQVLVHDLVGDIGSSEGMVPFVADARTRFLAPGAMHIPCRCITEARLCEDPRLGPAEWALSWLLRGATAFERLSFVRFFGFPAEAVLSDPEVFEDILLADAIPGTTRREVLFSVKRDGLLRGLCLSIRLFLDPDHVIDTWASHTSWSTPYLRLPAATPVEAGETITMTVETDLSASPSYSVVLRRGSGATGAEIGRYAWSGD
jgi:protein arginine N-methyltransferase 1